MKQEYRFQVFRLSPWQVWLASVIAFAIAAALVVVTAGFLLILLPIALVGALIWRLLYGSPKPRQEGKVIEVEYAVIDDGKPQNAPSRKLSGRF